VQIISWVLTVVLVKFLVLYALGKLIRLKTPDNLMFSFSLSQVGEFAFVLFSYIGTMQILSREDVETMMAITALSMTVTPMLLLINEKWIQPIFMKNKKQEKEADVVDEHNKVIIAGFSHFGSTIGRLLRANGVHATILDHDPDRVDLLRKMGFKVFYGDVTRIDLLESAGVEEARIFISAIDDINTNMLLLDTLRKHFPHLKIMVRARNRYDAYELMELSPEKIYREHIDTSIRMGVDVLHLLGMRAYTATRAGQNFFKYDEAALVKLSTQRHNLSDYIASVREEIAHQEELLQTDLDFKPNENDHAWDSEGMRRSLG
jgi:monovalent cation:H+ antiporter-2, CPA2 family